MTRKSFIIKASIITAIAVAVPFVCCEKLSVTYYDIPEPKLSAPVRIAFLSDLHNTQYGAGMSELINAVDKTSPDAVVFGGDLFDSRWNEKNTQLLIKALVQRYPCYYAVGNHEFYNNEQDIIMRETAALGVKVLSGTYSELETNGGTVRFIGSDKWLGNSTDISAAVSDNAVNILIYHYPEDFPKLKGQGCSLILSGHAHGGQWRFPPLINGVYSPGEGFFPKYTSGLYTDGNDRMLVSRGLARTVRDIIFPRVFNRPALVCITLTPHS